MTPFAISGLLAGLSSICFGILVGFSSHNRKIGRTWFLFTLSVGIWGLGGVWIGLAKTTAESLFAWRLAYALGVIWIPALFYQFVATFLEQRKPISILCNYIVATCFVLASPTSLFFARVRWMFNSIYYAQAGKLYFIFFVWWLGLVVYSHFELFRLYGSVSADKKNQIKYFFVATAVGFLGGSMAYLPNFGVNIYPWGNFTVCLYPFIMSLAIIKHRLMDINVIIRKTLIYSVVTFTLTAIYLGTIAIFTHIFEGLTGYQTMFSSAVAAALITLGFQPLRKRVQTFVDGKFFRQYVDREEKLYELSREVVTHTTPETMSSALLRVIEETIHPKSAVLYLRRSNGTGFVRSSIIGNSVFTSEMTEGNPLQAYFLGHPQPFVQDLSADLAESQDTRRTLPRGKNAA